MFLAPEKSVYMSILKRGLSLEGFFWGKCWWALKIVLLILGLAWVVVNLFSSWQIIKKKWTIDETFDGFQIKYLSALNISIIAIPRDDIEMNHV